jgi:tryptophan-rich sensory protein
VDQKNIEILRSGRPGGRIGGGLAGLWIAILLTIEAFFQVAPLAGWLMVPYLLWVTFASGLNFTIWRLNE